MYKIKLPVVKSELQNFCMRPEILKDIIEQNYCNESKFYCFKGQINERDFDIVIFNYNKKIVGINAYFHGRLWYQDSVDEGFIYDLNCVNKEKYKIDDIPLNQKIAKEICQSYIDMVNDGMGFFYNE